MEAHHIGVQHLHGFQHIQAVPPIGVDNDHIAFVKPRTQAGHPVIGVFHILRRQVAGVEDVVLFLLLLEVNVIPDGDRKGHGFRIPLPAFRDLALGGVQRKAVGLERIGFRVVQPPIGCKQIFQPERICILFAHGRVKHRVEIIV